MNDQPIMPNLASPEQSGRGPSPEDLQVAPAEQRVMPEKAAPAPVEQVNQSPGATPPPVAAQPVLTQDQAMAAVAAVPGPSGPGVVPAAGVPLPAAAADIDVIEPEWVAKADDVVQKHIGDPYGEEEEIEDLQQDYLMKRYGYKVADPDTNGAKPEGK